MHSTALRLLFTHMSEYLIVLSIYQPIQRNAIVWVLNFSKWKQTFKLNLQTEKSLVYSSPHLLFSGERREKQKRLEALFLAHTWTLQIKYCQGVLMETNKEL